MSVYLEDFQKGISLLFWGFLNHPFWKEFYFAVILFRSVVQAPSWFLDWENHFAKVVFHAFFAPFPDRKTRGSPKQHLGQWDNGTHGGNIPVGEHWQSGPRTVLGTWWQELPSEATRCFQLVGGEWIFEFGRTDKNRCLESRWQWVVDLKKTFRYIRNAYEMDQKSTLRCNMRLLFGTYVWQLVMDHELGFDPFDLGEDGARDIEHLLLPGN